MRDRNLELELSQSDQLDEFERQLSRVWPLTVLALLILCGLLLLSLPMTSDEEAHHREPSGSFLR